MVRASARLASIDRCGPTAGGKDASLASDVAGAAVDPDPGDPGEIGYPGFVPLGPMDAHWQLASVTLRTNTLRD
jgi:hypothetical protein